MVQCGGLHPIVPSLYVTIALGSLVQMGLFLDLPPIAMAQHGAALLCVPVGSSPTGHTPRLWRPDLSPEGASSGLHTE